MYVKSNFSSIPVIIIKLETSGLGLTGSINVVSTIKNFIKKIKSNWIKWKFKIYYVLNKKKILKY